MNEGTIIKLWVCAKYSKISVAWMIEDSKSFRMLEIEHSVTMNAIYEE